MCVLSYFSRVWLFETLWTIAHQAPLSMEFSRQEHWSGLPCPSPGNFPNPGIETTSLSSPALAGRFFTTRAPWETWEPLSKSYPSKGYTVDFSFLGLPCSSAGKESACNVGDLGSIPELGRSLGEGKGYTLQYSGLENSMDCIVHGVPKSWTQPRDFHVFFFSILFTYLNSVEILPFLTT